MNWKRSGISKNGLKKNDNYLKERFPRLGKRMIRRFKHISTKGFAFIALEETIILLLLLLYAFFDKRPEIGMGIVFTLSIHWLLTVIQSFMIRRIIPGTYTALVGFCFCLYTFIELASGYPVIDYMSFGLLFFVFAMINLWGMHLLVAYYRKSKIK